MRVICIEGPHGCGKTTAVRTLKEQGYHVLYENFLDMPKYGLKPQCFTIEIIWVTKWIERLLALKDIVPEDTVFYADRSPFSVLFYAPRGHILEPMLNELIEDLLATADIEIITVYVRIPRETLWSQIKSRLDVEPERAKYNEDSQSHMDKVIEFYESKKHLWNYTITAADANTILSIE